MVPQSLSVPGPTVGLIGAAPGPAPAGRPSINHMRDHHPVAQGSHIKNLDIHLPIKEKTVKSSSYTLFSYQKYIVFVLSMLGFVRKIKFYAILL